LIEEDCGLRAGEEKTGLSVADVREFNVVHDDEAVEEGDQSWELAGCCFNEEGIGRGEDVSVALNAALCAEDEVVTAGAGLEVLDGVGHHAVEPAHAVFARDANPARVIGGRDAGSVEEGAKLGRWGDCFGMGRGDHRGHSGRRVKLCVHLIIAVD
jgi:hypothetical protein